MAAQETKVPTTRQLQRDYGCSRRQAVTVHRLMAGSRDEPGVTLGEALGRAKQPRGTQAAA